MNINGIKILIPKYKSHVTYLKKKWNKGFPGCSVVGSPASGAGGVGLIPFWGTKIPYAAGHLSPCAITREKSIYLNERSHMPQLRFDAAKNE